MSDTIIKLKSVGIKIWLITGDKVELKIRTYNAAMKWVMKDYFFPKYVKTKSIPYFKKMRELVVLKYSNI